MRAAPMAAVLLALLLLAASAPVDAKPLHATKTPKIVRHELGEAREAGGAAVAEARALLASHVGPYVGRPTHTGELEIRAALTQPAVAGRDEAMAVLWIGAREGTWKGAYWADGASGSLAPGYLEVDEVGALLWLEGAALAQDGAVRATFHFLGVDGAHRTRALGPLPVLDAMPVLDRVDIGGAVAVERAELSAILITPWNLLERNVTMGLTLRAGDAALETLVAPACADHDAMHTEPGCRLLYVLPLADALTHVDVWRMHEGDRVVDRTLDRAALLAGATFTP